jgi:hypothetical protein
MTNYVRRRRNRRICQNLLDAALWLSLAVFVVALLRWGATL